MTTSDSNSDAQEALRALLREAVEREAVIDKRGAQKRAASAAGLSEAHMSRILNGADAASSTIAHVTARLSGCGTRWTAENDPDQEHVRGLVMQYGERLRNARGWRAEFCRLADLREDHLSHFLARRRRMSLRAVRRIEGVVEGASGDDGMRRDPEVAAMETLVALDDETRARVIAWAVRRWGTRSEP